MMKWETITFCDTGKNYYLHKVGKDYVREIDCVRCPDNGKCKDKKCTCDPAYDYREGLCQEKSEIEHRAYKYLK